MFIFQQSEKFVVGGWLVGWYFKLSGRWVDDGPAAKDHCTSAGSLIGQYLYRVSCEWNCVYIRCITLAYDIIIYVYWVLCVEHTE